MIERIVLTTLIIVGFMVAYRVWNWLQMQRITQTDPLLVNFESGKPGVILFTADHCAPCKFQQRPALQRLKAETQELQVIEVDVEANPEAAQRWGVMSLPTTYVLDKAGQPKAINHGVTSTEKLKQQLESIA